MANTISTLTDFISSVNALYESDSTSPTSGDEDFLVWTSLANLAINLWENEEGIMWKELFTKLSSASDGDKTVTAGDYSYATPTNFRAPASGYIWLGSGTSKTPYRVIKIEEVQAAETDSGNWCYFTGSTLEFNPNCTLTTGLTISYNYYKYATKLTTGSSAFEMSDPGFAVYYTVSELKKEEGDTTSAAIATQKMEAMKTKNLMTAWLQGSTFPRSDEGFGQ